MTAPIPITLALRAVRMAMEDCDKATPGPWDANVYEDGAFEILAVLNGGSVATLCTRAEWPHRNKMSAANGRFVALARAALRPALEYQRDLLIAYEDAGCEPIDAAEPEYRIFAALIAHYEATRPGWREETR